MAAKTSHNWMIREINRRWAARLAPLARGELLDVGCGEKPYEPLFRPYVTRYVGLEHPDTRHHRDKVDVWGAADDLPFDEGSFDTVTAFQVLEHCEDPQRVVDELHRVLRPGGVAMITTPFLWGIHEEPRDFFRYTNFGLTHLLRTAGFHDIQVRAVCGYWATAGLRFSYNLRRYDRRPLGPVIKPLQHITQGTAAVLDRLDRVETDTAGYVTVARR